MPLYQQITENTPSYVIGRQHYRGTHYASADVFADMLLSLVVFEHPFSKATKVCNSTFSAGPMLCAVQIGMCTKGKEERPIIRCIAFSGLRLDCQGSVSLSFCFYQ